VILAGQRPAGPFVHAKHPPFFRSTGDDREKSFAREEGVCFDYFLGAVPFIYFYFSHFQITSNTALVFIPFFSSSPTFQ
jgi:hypothetical protein